MSDLGATDLPETFFGKVSWMSEIISALARVPTIKPVLLSEAVKFAKLLHVGCQSSVSPFRLPAFLHASLLANSDRSAS